jgi:hypothetical protein
MMPAGQPITASITSAQQQLDALDNDAVAAQDNLHKALALVQDCETAYIKAPPALRRQFNQAFFKRLLVDDTFTVTGELAEPFAILLSDEMRQAAGEHAEQRHRPGTDDVADATVEHDEPELALVGAGAGLQVKGLNKKTMVGGRGLEPPTSSV